MNLQGRNLQEGFTGDDVHLLHTELAQLNLVASDDERARAFFGPTTLAMVQQLQQHTLPASGIVDPATAAAINAALNADARHVHRFPAASTAGSAHRVGGLKFHRIAKASSG
jgi:peptidoglycan hydrolase-like protein with peptidoglycan-binding domain